jgi:hypothetical protein
MLGLGCEDGDGDEEDCRSSELKLVMKECRIFYTQEESSS